MVRVYTMEGCPYCDKLKGLLKDDDIEFKEIDINDKRYKLEFNKIMEISGADSVPIVIVKKKILIPEKSFMTIEEGFEIIKKLLNE
jgi:glutaredoxin